MLTDFYKRLALWSVVIFAAPFLSAVPAQAIENIAILGDSYAAGKGNTVYTDGRHFNQNHRYRCDASPLSFGVQMAERLGIAAENIYHLACSGAKSEQIKRQIDHLVNLLDGKPLDLIVLTTGGNDVEFDAIAMNALSSNNVALRYRAPVRFMDDTKVKGRLDQTLGAIEDAFDHINRHFPDTQVIVAGYPMLVDPKLDEDCTFYLENTGFRGRFSKTDKVWVREMNRTLNQIIEDQATEAGFQFVSLTDAFETRGICAPLEQSWLFTVAFDWEAFDVKYTHFLHPKPAGQTKIAELMEQAYYRNEPSRHRYPYRPLLRVAIVEDDQGNWIPDLSHVENATGLRFEWDLDGDGSIEVVAPSIPKPHPIMPGDRYVRLKVSTADGRTAYARKVVSGDQTMSGVRIKILFDEEPMILEGPLEGGQIFMSHKIILGIEALKLDGYIRDTKFQQLHRVQFNLHRPFFSIGKLTGTIKVTDPQGDTYTGFVNDRRVFSRERQVYDFIDDVNPYPNGARGQFRYGLFGPTVKWEVYKADSQFLPPSPGDQDVIDRMK